MIHRHPQVISKAYSSFRVRACMQVSNICRKPRCSLAQTLIASCKPHIAASYRPWANEANVPVSIL
eukprot:IDg20395t1